jgi:hypothetical protein
VELNTKLKAFIPDYIPAVGACIEGFGVPFLISIAPFAPRAPAPRDALVYTIVHPLERDAAIAAGTETPLPSYEDAHHEIAVASGLVNDGDNSNASAAQKVIQADVVAIVPHVNEANAISQSLDKKVFFEAVLRDPDGTRSCSIVSAQIQIQCHDFAREVSWMWARSDFFNRKCLMQEMYVQTLSTAVLCFSYFFLFPLYPAALLLCCPAVGLTNFRATIPFLRSTVLTISVDVGELS